jgi:thioredoxin-like negative regulator of GroEL
MADVLEATRETFSELTAGGRVLVDVWGPQCAPCIALMPDVERLARERDDLTIVKLEAPKARRVCIDLRVMGLPTFLLFEDGVEVGRITDPDLTWPTLTAWLDEIAPAEREVKR